VWPRLLQVGRWAALGVGAAVAELALLRALVEGLMLPPWLASAVAAEALILARFVIADRWVFLQARPSLGRLVRYQGACLGALLVYLVTFNILVGGFGALYAVAFVLGTGASFVWSLATNFLWVWRGAPAHPGDPAGSPGAPPASVSTEGWH
jgi:putative flippase GtrA